MGKKTGGTLRRLRRERLEDGQAVAAAEQQVRRVPASRTGQLVLLCDKCERKLKKAGDPERLGRLGEVLGRVAAEDGLSLRVVQTGCLKLCPEGGVTVTTERMLGRQPAEARVVRTQEDVAALYEELLREELLQEGRRRAGTAAERAVAVEPVAAGA